jgi:aquaporin Z
MSSRIITGNLLRNHWPEYLMEAAELGIFMISAATFGVLLGHPDSPLHRMIPGPFARRLIGGCAMGLTAIGLIYSPWGKQSGAHMNPSLTLTFLRLGKVSRADAFWYICAQFAGGIAGVIAARTYLGSSLGHPAVNYVTTVPGPWGNAAAFAGEFLIAFLMMSTVLIVSNTPTLARYTGLFGGALVALYITFEDPFSGMSMNPARTLGSAIVAMRWSALWIYFTAPPLAMLAAAELYVRMHRGRPIACAKLHHENDKRCIHCGANM